MTLTCNPQLRFPTPVTFRPMPGTHFFKNRFSLPTGIDDQVAARVKGTACRKVEGVGNLARNSLKPGLSLLVPRKGAQKARTRKINVLSLKCSRTRAQPGCIWATSGTIPWAMPMPASSACRASMSFIRWDMMPSACLRRTPRSRTRPIPRTIPRRP